MVIVLSSCGGGDSNQPSITNDGYDRGALLVNLTDNIIIPSFNQFSNELSDLNQSFQTFSSDLTQNNLLDLFVHLDPVSYTHLTLPTSDLV